MLAQAGSLWRDLPRIRQAAEEAEEDAQRYVRSPTVRQMVPEYWRNHRATQVPVQPFAHQMRSSTPRKRPMQKLTSWAVKIDNLEAKLKGQNAEIDAHQSKLRRLLQSRLTTMSLLRRQRRLQIEERRLQHRLPDLREDSDEGLDEFLFGQTPKHSRQMLPCHLRLV